MKAALLITCLFLLIPVSGNAQESTPAEKVRPKADFLQNRLNVMMQNTASWLDTVGDRHDSDEHIGDKAADDLSDINVKEGNISEKEPNLASANGYLQLSWLPRTADLDDVDANFKVALYLPNWNDRLALVIDNDSEDELLLDYESNYVNEQDSVNIAFQYIKQFNQQRQIKNRVGVSRKQLYLRSEMQFNWQVQQVNFKIQPRIDYFLQDGWGPGAKAVGTYQFDKSYFSLSASWQKIQSEARSRRKLGFYHVSPTGKNQLLVSGVQYIKSNSKDDIANESYYISTRYRNLVYKSWMFVEVEPFIEFNQLNDFRREAGIALSIISYYGG